MPDGDRELHEEQLHLERTVDAFEQALAELTSPRSTSSGIDEFANEALERMRRLSRRKSTCWTST